MTPPESLDDQEQLRWMVAHGAMLEELNAAALEGWDDEPDLRVVHL
jgi:hypothetical protein